MSFQINLEITFFFAHFFHLLLWLVFLCIVHVSSPSFFINFRFTRRETLHLGRAFPKRSIEPTPTKTKVWMDYRVKEDSIDEDSVSSPKRIELSENTVDQENEENIDPKSTEGQGFDEGGFKEPVVETISPEKQTEFPIMKNPTFNSMNKFLFLMDSLNYAILAGPLVAF